MKLYSISSMNVTELFRNRLFFFIAKIGGLGFYKQILEIQKDYKDPQTEKRKKELLIYLRKNVPFYKRLAENENFNSLPVIDKQIIKSNKVDFVSSKYQIKDLSTVSTSGSSGTPMSFYRDKSKRERQIAEVLFLGQPINFYFGIKHGFIRATKPKSKLKLAIENQYHIDPTKLSHDNLEEVRKKFKKLKNVVGFPSTLYEIAKYCESKGDTSRDFILKGMICTAEPLLDKQRSAIERVFGCPIQERYATEELGLVAVRNPREKFYRINISSFFVEILKINEDFPAEFGEEGRIVVTDLESKAMPLARYDTGDLGVTNLENIAGKDTVVLSSITGRSIETIYSPEGEKISPFSINVKMKDLLGVKKFQFIQKEEKKYSMNIVPEDSDLSLIEIERVLSEILGREAIINIHLVSEIPKLPSGKTTYIINEYINKQKSNKGDLNAT